MARKKLEAKQQKELEKMVMEGRTPEDVSKTFGIAVSSVHNYKRMLKKQGLSIPDVRGKRPSNTPNTHVQRIFTEKPNGTNLSNDAPAPGFIKITINDVVFYISPDSRSVNIENGTLVVKF